MSRRLRSRASNHAAGTPAQPQALLTTYKLDTLGVYCLILYNLYFINGECSAISPGSTAGPFSYGSLSRPDLS